MNTIVYFIHLVWSGLLNENEPVITTSKETAFREYAKLLQSIGYRAPKKKETFEQYREAFTEFEWKYRNEYPEITKKDLKANIANPNEWNTEENEVMFFEQPLK